MSSLSTAEDTPGGRDRFVDLVRAGSILVVVAGHWLMAVVSWDGGSVRTANLLEIVPALQPATWVLQVMPLFFVVGGFANAGSWDSVRRRGGCYADFVAHRIGRLLRPVAPFLLLWVALAAVLQLAGQHGPAVESALLVAVQPLWFVALYALVVATTPVMLAAHRRAGARVLLALVLVIVAVDALRLGTSAHAVGYLNYAAVWLLAHQLGFHAEAVGRLPRRVLTWTVLGAIGGLAALTQLGPYPTSMVGLSGQISNLSPPTLCVAVLVTGQVALLLLVRGAANRWLARPRVWAGVVAVNSMIMTVFLWHLTALVVVAAAGSALQVPMPAVASLGWWLLRPVWFAVLAVVLVPLLAALGRVERAGLGRRRPVGTPHAAASWAAGLGAAWVVLGMSGLALCGLAGLWAGREVALLHLHLTPLVALLDLGLGAALVQLAARRGQPNRRLTAAGLSLLVAAVVWMAVPGVTALLPDAARAGALSWLATGLVLLAAARRRGRGTAATAG